MVLRLIEKVTEIRDTPLNLEKALEHYIIAVYSFTSVLNIAIWFCLLSGCFTLMYCALSTN